MNSNGKDRTQPAGQAGANGHLAILQCEVVEKRRTLEDAVKLVDEEAPALLSQFLYDLDERIQHQLERVTHPNVQGRFTRLRCDVLELDTERGD